MDNNNVSELLSMLSNMNKSDLQNGLAQAEKFLNSQDKQKLEELLKGLK